ncbi:MAG: cell division protein ZapA [Fusicatenibacter sp.]|nr:cell division protein ZapA [Fusicatenibacter sp.]
MAVKNTTQVLIDGKIVTLSGYESPEYLQKVASYLNQKISELSQLSGYNRLSVDTKHTLLALNIADDYFKAKNQVDTLEEDMESKDRENYDMKHDLIAAELQTKDLRKELEEQKIENERLRGEKNELQRQLTKTNEELEELLKA